MSENHKTETCFYCGLPVEMMLSSYLHAGEWMFAKQCPNCFARGPLTYTKGAAMESRPTVPPEVREALTKIPEYTENPWIDAVFNYVRRMAGEGGE